MRLLYKGDYVKGEHYPPGSIVKRDGRYVVYSHNGWQDVAAPPDASCIGPPGRDGVDGRDSTVPGPRGNDGADSTVPGPRGPRGKRGPKAEPGATYYSVRRTTQGATVTTGWSESVAFGDVVRVAGDGVAAKALAHGSDAAALAVGVCNGSTSYQTSGVLENPAWNLTPGTVYYLSPTTPGAITSVFPDAPGNRVVIVGSALTPTKLNIAIHWAGEIGT